MKYTIFSNRNPHFHKDAKKLVRTAESLEKAKDMIARFVGPLDVARDTGLVHPRRLVWYTIEADDEVVYKSMDCIL